MVRPIRYILRFPPNQLPPVNAFWSLTLYELPASLLSANPLNRYLINSPMLPDLKTDADGGHHAVRPKRLAGQGRGVQLAPRSEGPLLHGAAAVLAEAGSAERKTWTAPPLQRAGRPWR